MNNCPQCSALKEEHGKAIAALQAAVASVQSRLGIAEHDIQGLFASIPERPTPPAAAAPASAIDLLKQLEKFMAESHGDIWVAMRELPGAGEWARQLRKVLAQPTEVPSHPTSGTASVLTEKEQESVTRWKTYGSPNISGLSNAAAIIDPLAKELADAQRDWRNAVDLLAQRDRELAEANAKLAKKELELVDANRVNWRASWDQAHANNNALRQQLAAEKQAAGEAKKAYELAQAEANTEIERLTVLLDTAKAEVAKIKNKTRKPDGYAYQYHDGLRFNSGESVNGGKPGKAVPYWFDGPPEPAEPGIMTEHAEIENLARDCGWDHSQRERLTLVEFIRASMSTTEPRPMGVGK